MDDYLEKLIAELGETINEAIQNSDAVSDVMERIRATGSDVTLAVEATIAPGDKGQERFSYTGEEPEKEVSIEDRLRDLSQEDRQFLRSLKIKVDNDE